MVKIMNPFYQMCLDLHVKSLVNKHRQMFGQEVDEQFVGIIDDLIVMSDGDGELADGLKWIDTQSRRQGISFYEMALLILRKHLAENRAKEWMRSRRVEP